LHDADQVGRVAEIAVVQDEPPLALVRILVEMIDTIGIEERRTALDAVDFVTLLQQELREVGAVLPRGARDQCPPSRCHRVS
jgi:hypothetical protein